MCTLFLESRCQGSQRKAIARVPQLKILLGEGEKNIPSRLDVKNTCAEMESRRDTLRINVKLSMAGSYKEKMCVKSKFKKKSYRQQNCVLKAKLEGKESKK